MTYSAHRAGQEMPLVTSLPICECSPVPPAQPRAHREGSERGRRNLPSSPGLFPEWPIQKWQIHPSSRVPPTALDATTKIFQLRRKDKTTGKVLGWAFSKLQLTSGWVSQQVHSSNAHHIYKHHKTAIKIPRDRWEHLVFIALATQPENHTKTLLHINALLKQRKV